MNLPAFVDNGFEVDIRPALLRKPWHRRTQLLLSSGFAYFIRFEGPFDNVGYRAVFTAGKPVSKITRFCAPYRKLRFGHADLLCDRI